jgi:hypothetical protein
MTILLRALRALKTAANIVFLFASLALAVAHALSA